MGLTYRDIKGAPLSFSEMDSNIRHFTGSHSITGSLTLKSGSINVSGSGTVLTNNQPSQTLTGSLSITGSVTINNILTLSSVSTLPTAVNGALIVSSSGDLYFGSGSAWNKVSLS